MAGLIRSDALFAQKGQAAPAVQAAIQPTRPNRFEAFARTLGQNEPSFDDDEAESALPLATGVERTASVTPFPKPRAPGYADNASAILDRTRSTGWSGTPAVTRSAPWPAATIPADPAERHCLDSGWSRRRAPTPLAAAPETAAQAPATEGGPPTATVAATSTAVSDLITVSAVMIRRAPQHPPAPIRPWHRIQTNPACADKTRADDAPPTTAIVPDPLASRAATKVEPQDLKANLTQMETSSVRDAGPAEDPVFMDSSRRRYVSVGLPEREHGLLRQFALVCGSTQQDVVRRAVLTYMMAELQRRLEISPPPALSARPQAWASFSQDLAPATPPSRH